ncbi:MAG: penicillin acylase family protein [Deltaproteobacteria bacterium]|nr:MAG: penicillin acylase family protein [Deltaproteobacteria bacterium]
MNASKRWFLIALFLLVPLALSSCTHLGMNRYQAGGGGTLPGLKEPVTVVRDEKGMAYIYARNTEDVMLAFGFTTAQDRLFQMELIRLFAAGRISEMIGEKGEPIDTRMRTIGFHRNAKRHVSIMDPGTKNLIQKYIDGVNAFIQTRAGEYPLEYKLAGIKPKLWDVEESMAVFYLMSWDSAANIETEIIAQMLVEKVGPEKAKEILPLNINPDDEVKGKTSIRIPAVETAHLNFISDKNLQAFLQERPLQVGSNNWVAGPQLSAGGKPIVSNDPHLDARTLPGPWYPCGLITPESRWVGVGIPGIPSMIVGRNEHIAVGVTNAYGDAQDLYVETIDPKNPARYLEGDQSLPFEVITERLSIKDKNAPGGKREKEIKIRLTRRGPVVSGVLSGLKTDKVVTLRWAPFETMGPFIGADRIMPAKSAEEVRQALSRFDIMMLNFVFADKDGNIGWIASGKLPIRSQGDGTVPYVVKDGKDNWVGWIPFEKNPQLHNPQKGWMGTCNHNTVGKDYPYYYSSHLSPSYRYRRLIQLMEAPGKKSVDDHWQYQRDSMNLMAKEIAPIMAKALLAHPDSKELGEILSKWDYLDHTDQAAPTIFQAVYREFALLVFQDELGDDLAKAMLKVWYFWQERLQRMVLEGNSPWFDNILTKDVKETRGNLFHKAAQIASEKLRSSLGQDPKGWQWGKIHTIEFVSPIRREGFGKGLLGDGPYPFPGSAETLHRAIFAFSDSFKVTTSASLRMVADLSDDDKILAVLPGGVSGRFFHPHAKDQIKAFISGEKVYWWFSDKAIQENKKATLTLKPN